MNEKYIVLNLTLVNKTQGLLNHNKFKRVIERMGYNWEKLTILILITLSIPSLFLLGGFVIFLSTGYLSSPEIFMTIGFTLVIFSGYIGKVFAKFLKTPQTDENYLKYYQNLKIVSIMVPVFFVVVYLWWFL
ncbi:MAG: hypothetical protein ACXAD7_15870 [Candidatus Kariarchaeaceae archaeon]|jgi:hypothetical protein